MKMTVKEFVKLDLTSLMQVNGGTSACGNYTQTQPATPPSGGNETDNAPSNNGGGTGESANTNDTPSSYSPGYSGGSTTGTTTGTCGGSGGQTPLENPPKTNDKPNNDTTNNNNNNGGSTSVGGCSSINGGNGNGDGDELKGKESKEDDDVANDLPTEPSTPPEQPTSPDSPNEPDSPTTGPNGGSTGNQDNGNGDRNQNNFNNLDTGDNQLPYQIPDDPTDYHCDINSYNVALDQGITNPGTWDGNSLGVHEIYNLYYNNVSTDRPVEGSQGYGFCDDDGDGIYNHMFYYRYDGGDSYHVWNSNGIDPVSEFDWSIYGRTINDSVFVPLE